MMELDDVVYRNMQEQIEANRKNIQNIFQGGTSFKLSYWLDSKDDLPGTANIGDAALVQGTVLSDNGLYVWLIFKDNTQGWKRISDSFPVKGDDGLDGMNGLDGEKGPKGDKGDKGNPGVNGVNGNYVVVANPTLGGSEPNLTGLNVDGVKYKVDVDTSNFYNKTEVDGKVSDALNDAEEYTDNAVTGLAAMSEVNDAIDDHNSSGSAHSALFANKSKVTGTNDGTNWQTVTIDGVTKNIPSGGSTYSAGDGITLSGTEISAKVGTGLFFDANDRIAFNNLAQTVYNSGITSSKVSTYDGYAAQISSKSTVSGTNDGTNWQTVTIDGVTKNIPVGGGSSFHLYKHVCHGSSGDIVYSITAITTSPLSIADDYSRLNYAINVTATVDNLGVLGYYTNASDINTLAVYIAGTNNDMYIYGLDGEYIDEAFLTEDTITQIA